MNAVVAPSWFEKSPRYLSERRPSAHEKRIYTLSARATEPEWVLPTAKAIAELLSLAPNWDSYGAHPIRSDRAQALWDILTQVMAPESIAPTIVPIADGSLQAEWHTHGVDMEIEPIGPSTVRVYYRGHGQEWEEHFSVDMTRVVAAIDGVAA